MMCAMTSTHKPDLSQPQPFAPLPDFTRMPDDLLADIAADRAASLAWRTGAQDELRERDLDQDHADLQMGV